MGMVSVEVKGLDELRRKCALVASDELPRGMIRDLAAYTKSRIAVHARPHPADRGTLGAGAVVELGGPGEPLGARVGYLGRSSVAAIARAVNDGQPATPSRSPRQLLGMAYGLGRWAQRHGYIGEATTAPKTKRGHRPVPSAAAILLAQRVAHQGTRAVRFMEQAQDDADRRAQELVKDLALEIERRWSR